MFKIFKRKRRPKEVPPMVGKEVKEAEKIEPKPAREKELSGVIEAMPDALIVLDPNGVITHVNPAMTKIFGYTPEERIGKSFDELMDSIKPEDIKRFMKLLGVLIEGGEVGPVEVALGTKDGREIQVSIAHSLIRDAEGNPKNIIAMLRDITELKRAEEERVRVKIKAEAEAEAARATTELIQGMHDALIVVDFDGKILFANPAQLQMFGHKSLDELVGKSFAELPDAFINPEEDIPKFLEMLKELIEKGYTEQPVEVKLQRVDGTKEFVASATATVIKDAKGKPVNLVATLRDITELKRAQEKEKEASAAAATARIATDTIKAMGDGVVLFAMDGKIISVNTALERITGYGKSEIVEKNIADLTSKWIKPEDVEKAMEVLGTTLEGKVPAPATLTLIRKDGREVPIAYTTSFIKDAKDNITHIISTIKDITELKRAHEKEKELEAAQGREAVIDAMPDSLVVLNLDGEIIYVNPAHLKMFGHKSADEIIMVGFDGFKERFPDPEKDIPMFLGLFKQVIEKGSTEEYLELRLRKVGGEEFFVSASASLLRDAEGNPKNVVAVLRDITELKRLQEVEREAVAENARAEEAEKYSKEIEKDRKVLDNIIELNPYSVQICDAEGHHIRANKAFEKLFGATPLPEWSLFNDPLLKKAGASELLEKLKKGETIKIPAIWYNAHDIIPKAPDNPICLGAIHFSIFDNTGNLQFIVNMHEDITNLKRAQDEAVAAKSYVDNIIKSMIDTLIVVNPDTTIRSVNKSACDLLGYKEEELIGKPVGTIFEEEEEEEEEEELLFKGLGIEELIKMGFVRNIEMTYKSKDGKKIPVLFSGSVMRDENRKILGVVCVAQDITEHKRMEEKERKLAAGKLATDTIEAMIDVVGISDMEGRITQINTAVEYWGYKKEELIGKPVVEVIAKRSLPKLEEERKKTLETGIMRNLELIGFKKDGSEFPVLVNVTLMKGVEGNPTGRIFTLRDITELKRLQEIEKDAAASDAARKEAEAGRKKLETYMESMIDAVGSTDINGNIVMGNRALEELTGYTKDELLKMNPAQLTAKQDVEKNMNAIKECLEKGFVRDLKMNFITKQGKEVPISLNATRLEDDEGKPVGTIAVIRDITERKGAEEALKDSEYRFRTIFDSVVDGILLVDVESGKFHTGNRSICQMLGYSMEELKTIGVRDIHPEEDVPHLMERFEKIVKGHIGMGQDVLVKRKGGSVFYADINITQITLSEKMYLLGVFRDITDRKVVQEALKISEEKFRNMVETTSDWIWEVDENGVYTYASPQIKSILGYDTEEIIGKKQFDLMPEGEAKKISAEFREITNKKEPFYALENWNIHKDGSMVLLETSGVPLLDEEGNIKGYRGIDRDITKRKEAEEELKESEQKFRAIFDSSVDGMLLMDIKKEKFHLANKTICRMLNYKIEEILSLGMKGLHPPEDLSYILKQFNRQSRKKVIGVKDIPAKKKDGSIFYVDMNASKAMMGGQMYWLCIYKDLVERKKMEKELIQAEKLTVLGQLGAGVAHEINNPLGSIIGFTQMLMNEIPPSDHKFNDLERIESAAKRCKDMVGGLLKYTSPAKSKFDEVDINKLVEEVLFLFRQEIKLRSDIKIYKQLKALLPYIYGNYNQLQQVCMNILINARKALPKGGEIRVRTELSRNKKNIAIVFKDNGIGISRENLTKIFEPFFSLKESPESLGLGLGISKQIIAIHKGSIDVKSKINKGTTFTIKLPVYHK